ncbi:MAG: hypothetical protein K8F62_10590 [Pseudorhodoplanes sp.]|jgi:hypothetical protein|nr:hypothetical protein [Pseudorhodoplanes sp.]
MKEKARREAVMIFVGFAILMYFAAAYEYYVGFSRGKMGAIPAFIGFIRSYFGEHALLIFFIGFGTLFAILALKNRR